MAPWEEHENKLFGGGWKRPEGSDSLRASFGEELGMGRHVKMPMMSD